MPRFPEHTAAPQVREIVEAMVEHFPVMFEGFDPDKIDYICTRVKNEKKNPIKLHARTYPDIIFHSSPYLIEIFDKNWKFMNPKQKNLAVFHAMCGIPNGGCDAESPYYAKKVQPGIKMYFMEFAASGGVPNWMENPEASDPLERSEEEIKGASPGDDEEGDGPDVLSSGDESDDDIVRKPVTVEGIGEIKKEAASA